MWMTASLSALLWHKNTSAICVIVLKSILIQVLIVVGSRTNHWWLSAPASRHYAMTTTAPPCCEVVLHECHIRRFTVEECTLYPTDLERADQVFITSTTRELLLVEEIEGLRVQTRGGAREALQSAFPSYVDAYVAKKSGPLAAVHP